MYDSKLFHYLAKIDLIRFDLVHIWMTYLYLYMHGICKVFDFNAPAFCLAKMVNRIHCQMRNIYSNSSDIIKGPKCLWISLVPQSFEIYIPLNTDRESLIYSGKMCVQDNST